MATTAVYG